MKYRVSCCNTEHTGPVQRMDNWGTPEDRERGGEKVVYIWIKIKQIEKKEIYRGKISIKMVEAMRDKR